MSILSKVFSVELIDFQEIFDTFDRCTGFLSTERVTLLGFSWTRSETECVPRSTEVIVEPFDDVGASITFEGDFHGEFSLGCTYDVVRMWEIMCQRHPIPDGELSAMQSEIIRRLSKQELLGYPWV